MLFSLAEKSAETAIYFMREGIRERDLEHLRHRLAESVKTYEEGSEFLERELAKCHRWTPLSKLMEAEEIAQEELNRLIRQAKIERIGENIQGKDSGAKVEQLEEMLRNSVETQTVLGQIIEARLKTVKLITENRYSLEGLALAIAQIKDTLEAYKSR